jgi:hypothetical protein
VCLYRTMSKSVVHLTSASVHALRAAVGRFPASRAAQRLVSDLELAYASSDRHCVMCGCTDSRGCRGGCSWALKFPASLTGVCSKCWGKFISEVQLVDGEEIET